MQEQEKAIFQNYEVKNWDYSPRLYKILAAAAIFNLLGLLVLGQTNVLTARGCESPFVGRVCQVLDTVYIGSALLGTDTELKSHDYVKTEIEDADITYIDVSGVTPPLKYPEGYFAIANPESQFMSMENSFGDFSMTNPIPGIPGDPTISGGTDLLNTPQVTPTPNKDAIQGIIPTSPFSMGDNPIASNPVPPPSRTTGNRIKQPRRTPKIKSSPDVLPNLNEDLTAENKDKTIEPKQPEVKSSLLEDEGPNKKPLEDFGTKYGEQILSKQIDVNAPFTIEVVAELNKDGKFVNPKVVSKPGSDQKMTEVAKEAIAAFGDTKLLKPLYDVGGRSIKITFAQNQDNLQAIIQAETKSDSMAKTMQSGLNLYLKNFFKPKEGSDEAVLMEKAQFATQGKNFIINFLIPNDEKTQMIEKSLKGLQEKQKTNQLNNSNNVGASSNTNAK